MMKILIETESLRSALNKILSVVDKKNSRQILAYTLIKASDNKLEISATDLEVSAKVVVPAEVQSNGIFCINAKTFSDILREFPNSSLTLEINETENILNLKCNQIQFSLLIFKTDDFPHLTFVNSQSEFTLNAHQLLEIINKSSYAISTDETRPYMNGLFIQTINSKLRAVSTDGHRLALYEADINNIDSDSLINGIIIPKKGVFELKRMAETYPNTDLKISVDESFMYLNASNTYFLSIRLIAREYPKYQAVIPSKTSSVLNVDRELLLNAVKRIKIMSNEKSNGVRMTLSDKELLIAANHPSLGHGSETIEVDYAGKKMEIGFNARYLIDALTPFSSEDITIEFNNELSPVLIKSQELQNYLGIVMPLKL